VVCKAIVNRHLVIPVGRLHLTIGSMSVMAILHNQRGPGAPFPILE
jgi:hypothetical protein